MRDVEVLPITPNQIRKQMRDDLHNRVASVMSQEADILNTTVRHKITDKVVESLCGYLSDLYGPMQ